MSKRINQSGQIIVADRFVSLSDPDSKNYFRVTSSISSSDKLQESIVNDFLARYDLQIDGSTNISYGSTLTAKVYDRDNQEYVDFPSIEFSWQDVNGKIIKNSHNKLYIPADYKVEESTEKKIICTWSHVVDYSIGTTLKNIYVMVNTSVQLNVLDIVEYQWNNCLTEQELEEQGFKQLEWYTSVPANENNNLYLWSRRSTNNRISWNYYRTTGEKGQQGIPGKPGADGKTSYFHIKYSYIENPTSSSQMTEIPSTYIGTYVDFTESDSTDPAKYTWSRFEGMQGEKGDQGIPGIGQDGKTSYLHIAYSTSADGSEGFSITDSANKTYIGQYTDFVVSDSIDYTKYAWTKIKGDKGDQGIQGNPGLDGKSSYTHIAYSNSEDGSIDFSTTELSGKKYIGIYIDSEKEDSKDYTKYIWKKYVADETRIEYCWHHSEENIPKELSASYDSLDIYYGEELIWISIFDTRHSIKAPNKNDIHLWIRTSIDNGKNWEYSKISGNPAKVIKIITNRYYFDRNETNDKGEVGEYLKNQIANITLEKQNISGDVDVSWFFDGELYKTQSIKNNLIITPSMLNRLGKLYISVVYDNIIYDSIELYTNVIKPTYAGILPSDNTSPVTINGRECVNGDHFIYLDENGCPIARLYINEQWKDLSSTDSQYYSLVMGDILADVINKPSINSQNGIYQFFSNIAAYGAFIKNLYTENFKIDNGLFNLKIGTFNNKLTFDVLYNGNIIFSIDPYTGYIFLGKPNTDKTNPETGFMINPSDENNIISTKNGYFSIDKSGTLRTISMESIDSKFENATITNGEFSGYFNCYSIKTARESKEIYKQSNLYQSDVYLQCAKLLVNLNMQVYSETINYTEIYSCKFSLSDRIKYCRFQQWSNLTGNYLFQFVALQLFDENRNIIRPNDLGLNFIKNPNSERYANRYDINSIHSGYWRYSGSNNIDMVDSDLGLYLLYDFSIELYKGGNRLIVDIPGVDAFVDPSTITEQGRLYVDSNGFVKAKIFY